MKRLIDYIKDKILTIGGLKLTSNDGIVFLDTFHEDLPLNMFSAGAVNVNAPTLKVFRNDGQSSPSFAGEYNGSTSKGEVEYYEAMNTQDLTISMWIKPDKSDSIELLDRRGGGFEFYINNGAVYFKINGERVQTANGMVTVGATSHLVVTVTQEGANSRVKIYVNNQLRYETVKNVLLKNTSEGYLFGMYQNGGWYYDGIMDEIQIYNTALNDVQIDELYNNGTGIVTVPSGINEASQMIAHFSDSNVNEATLGNGHDMILTDVNFVEGIIGILNGSFGVIAEFWEAGKHTAKFGSMQMKHQKKLGSPINPHYHFSLSEPPQAGDTIYMELEYVWADPDNQFGNTTVVGITIDLDASGYTQDHYHYIKGFSDIDLSGENNVSMMCLLRLSRRGDKDEDTYQGDIVMYQFDFHYEIDSIGSRFRWIK